MNNKDALLNRMPLSGCKFKQLAFEILKFSDFNQENLPDEIKMSEHHFIDFHLILFCIKGEHQKINLTVNYIDLCLGEYDLLIIPKGSVITINVSTNHQGYSILFDDSFLKQNFIELSFLSTFWHLSNNEKLTLNKTDSLNLRQFYDLIYTEYHNEANSNTTIILQSLVKSLFLKLQDHIIQSNQTNQISYITYKKFEKLLVSSHNINKTTDFYCTALHLTSFKLNEICKLYCNQSAKKVLNLQIVFEAKKLLLFSQLNIQEIAFELGFSEATNFSKFFKRNVKKTPKEFRDS